MRAKTARRLAARRWVRHNRPAVAASLPAAVERLVLRRMESREDQPDLTFCDYFRGIGKCSSGCRTEPACQVDMPLQGWPRQRMAKGRWW